MVLPENLELRRGRVLCAADAPSYTESVQYAGAYNSVDYDNSLQFKQFKQNFKIEIQSMTQDEIVFDMIGIDAALANAFRRILIAEVPTMAIEKVLINENTSLIQDEVFAHRLGLVPIKADPKLFTEKTNEEVATEKNTIVFKMQVKCTKSQGVVKNNKVLSSELKWLPQGSTYEMNRDAHGTVKMYTTFNSSQETIPQLANDPIRPYNNDILLAKLRPPQAIELECHAVKGIGKNHAKWSPVATATYRMLPEVELKEDITDELAEELVRKCPVDVFDIEDIMGEKHARVAKPRNCTLCRECIRGEGWDKRVELRRVREHFIFTIESTGCIPAEELLGEALKVLMAKCQRIYNEL